MHVRTLLVSLLAAPAALHCVSAPRPSVESQRLARNTLAVVEGRVLDTRGRPVAGVVVEGLPRAADLPWSPGAKTSSDGTFRLRLYAPGEYGFLLSKDGVTIVTSDPSDPSREHVRVSPGERRTGIELYYLEEERARISPKS